MLLLYPGELYRLLGASSLNLHLNFHRAIFFIANPKYSNFGGILDTRMVILVSEDSNRYAHLFLIEREYFGFNTLESVVVEYI